MGTSEWGKYILAAILPVIFFYVIILQLKVNIHSTWILGFVIFSQQISLPPFLRIVYLYGEKSPFGSFLGYFTAFGTWIFFESTN